MSILDRITVVFLSLGEIFLACLPVVFTLHVLDKWMTKLTAKALDNYYSHLKEMLNDNNP